MKKSLFVMLLMLSIIIAGCGANKKDNEDKVIKVASQAPPMTDVVKEAAKEAKKDGWEIKLVQVNDNVAYNDMVSSKEADASFAQHKPFMEKYNSERKANLVAIQPIYDAKVGFYSKKYKDINDIPKGTKVAIPNDISNEGRALAILEEQGLIKLKDGVGVKWHYERYRRKS